MLRTVGTLVGTLIGCLTETLTTQMQRSDPAIMPPMLPTELCSNSTVPQSPVRPNHEPSSFSLPKVWGSLAVGCPSRRLANGLHGT